MRRFGVALVVALLVGLVPPAASPRRAEAVPVILAVPAVYCATIGSVACAALAAAITGAVIYAIGQGWPATSGTFEFIRHQLLVRAGLEQDDIIDLRNQYADHAKFVDIPADWAAAIEPATGRLPFRWVDVNRAQICFIDSGGYFKQAAQGGTGIYYEVMTGDWDSTIFEFHGPLDNPRVVYDSSSWRPGQSSDQTRVFHGSGSGACQTDFSGVSVAFDEETHWVIRFAMDAPAIAAPTDDNRRVHMPFGGVFDDTGNRGLDGLIGKPATGTYVDEDGITRPIGGSDATSGTDEGSQVIPGNVFSGVMEANRRITTLTNQVIALPTTIANLWNPAAAVTTFQATTWVSLTAASETHVPSCFVAPLAEMPVLWTGNITTPITVTLSFGSVIPGEHSASLTPVGGDLTRPASVLAVGVLMLLWAVGLIRRIFGGEAGVQ